MPVPFSKGSDGVGSSWGTAVKGKAKPSPVQQKELMLSSLKLWYHCKRCKYLSLSAVKQCYLLNQGRSPVTLREEILSAPLHHCFLASWTSLVGLQSNRQGRKMMENKNL